MFIVLRLTQPPSFLDVPTAFLASKDHPAWRPPGMVKVWSSHILYSTQQKPHSCLMQIWYLCTCKADIMRMVLGPPFTGSLTVGWWGGCRWDCRSWSSEVAQYSLCGIAGSKNLWVYKKGECSCSNKTSNGILVCCYCTAFGNWFILRICVAAFHLWCDTKHLSNQTGLHCYKFGYVSVHIPEWPWCPKLCWLQRLLSWMSVWPCRRCQLQCPHRLAFASAFFILKLRAGNDTH